MESAILHRIQVAGLRRIQGFFQRPWGFLKVILIFVRDQTAQKLNPQQAATVRIGATLPQM